MYILLLIICLSFSVENKFWSILKNLVKNSIDRINAAILCLFSFHLCVVLYECVLDVNVIVDHTFCKANISETISDEVIQRHYGPNIVVAEIKYMHAAPVQYCLSDVTVTEKLEKFVEDVK